MNFDEFTGELQHRLGTPDTGETVRSAHATLSTLGSRPPGGAAEDLRGMLPEGEDEANRHKLFAMVDADGWKEHSASAR